MIDVQAIDPLRLPSVPIEERRLLPSCAGVYFVIHRDGQEILYVGESERLASRLRNHDKSAEFHESEAGRIAWLAVENDKERVAVEQSFIFRFEPRLNRVGRRQFAAAEKRQIVTVRFPMSMYGAITQAARQQGHSLTQEIILAVQEHLDRLAVQSRADKFSESRDSPRYPIDKMMSL